MITFCLRIYTRHQGNFNGQETWAATLTRGKLQSRSCWRRSSQIFVNHDNSSKTVISEPHTGAGSIECTVKQSFLSTDFSDTHQSEVVPFRIHSIWGKLLKCSVKQSFLSADISEIRQPKIVKHPTLQRSINLKLFPSYFSQSGAFHYRKPFKQGHYFLLKGIINQVWQKMCLRTFLNEELSKFPSEVGSNPKSVVQRAYNTSNCVSRSFFSSQALALPLLCVHAGASTLSES